MSNFNGKTVAITGAGSGMGRASALLFAEKGARVAVIDKCEDAARQTAEEIRTKGFSASAFVCDVTNKADVVFTVDAIVQESGSIDVMFNNAGVGMSPTDTEWVAEAEIDRILDVNVKGVMYGAQAVIPYMKKQSSGVIMTTASIMGVRTRPGYSIYSASKAAAIMLTKSLALELAGFGIRVVGINPVAAATRMLHDFIGNQDLESGKKKFETTIPLGRVATADDVAQAAVFLASDEAAMVTGSFIDVDGGRGV